MADDFQKLIQSDRETRKRTLWKGNALEYLEIVRDNPAIPCLAHKRIYDMLIKAGVSEVNMEENPRMKRLFKGERVKTFNFFAEQFYGMEKTLNQIVRYFHSASLKGEESRQVLYL